jgi:hypothetical protein
MVTREWFSFERGFTLCTPAHQNRRGCCGGASNSYSFPQRIKVPFYLVLIPGLHRDWRFSFALVEVSALSKRTALYEILRLLLRLSNAAACIVAHVVASMRSAEDQ